jgi:hypothetical protein
MICPVCVCACLILRVRVCTNACVILRVCVCTSAKIQTDRDRDRERDRNRDRDRQSDLTAELCGEDFRDDAHLLRKLKGKEDVRLWVFVFCSHRIPEVDSGLGFGVWGLGVGSWGLGVWGLYGRYWTLGKKVTITKLEARIG